MFFISSFVVQGTNLRSYFMKVAGHHGLQFGVEEYEAAEDRGSHNESDMATFYVTNLREPVSHLQEDITWFSGCWLMIGLLFLTKIFNYMIC